MVVLTNLGQRYDVVVTASQVADITDYWMRAVPQSGCSNNNNSADIKGIVRYDSSSTADPSTSPYDGLSTSDPCADMPLTSLIPHVSQTVVDPRDDSDLTVTVTQNSAKLFKWQIGLNSMLVQWDDPSLLQISNGNASFEDEECVYQLPNADEWVYFVISSAIPVPHPIHLHGHDFFILAAEANAEYDSSVTLNLDNPPRRDVANLPTAGYLVISYKTDNPGAWLVSLFNPYIQWHQLTRIDALPYRMAYIRRSRTAVCRARK